MPLPAGHRIGPYEILARVGAGAMGEVYTARDTRLDRVVAIKVSREGFSERFHRESRAVAALNHPNICQLYDVGTDHLVMEHVEGAPVRPTDDVQALIDVAVQMADALVAAHEAGIVHRDLKPANVFLTRDGRVKVLDFGLALMAPSSPQAAAAAPTMAVTDPGTTVGTIAYMSPEQARGEPVDARSDLWSMGVVLYEMATGARPFEGGTTAVVFDAILNRPALSIRACRPRVPPDVERVVMRLLEKDRALRYQSAADLLADLRRLKRDSASKVPAAPLLTPPRAGRVRAPLVASALVGAAVVGGILLFWPRAQAAPLTEQDVIVLADFVNTTGEAVFDSTLRAALSIQLEDSPFLKIMSDDRVREGLRLMQRPAGERVTADVAREICRRLGEKATIGGEIARLGSAYALTLQAVNCATGDTIARVQTQAESLERVLAAMSEAARSLRATLGESLASIETLASSLEVTTSSIEALQAYALGTERFSQGDALGSVPHFERATALDPDFAMAWWFLASAYQNAGLGARGEYMDRAFELRERLSERERLSITAAYYGQRSGEWDKARDAAESWARTYPRVALPRFMLTGFWTFEGRPDDALREGREAARLEPANALIVAALVGLYARMDRFDEARSTAADAIARGLDAPGIHLNLLRIAFIEEDAAAIAREMDWFRGRPEEYLAMGAQAANAVMSGRRRDARETFAQAADLARRRGLPPGGGMIPFHEVITGSCPAVGQAAGIYLQAFCGDADLALRTVAERTQQNPTVSVWNSLERPLITAIVALRHGRPEEALDALGPASRHELYNPLVTYVRGRSYLERGDAAAAAAEFQKLVERRGIHWQFMPQLPRETGPLRAAAHVQLARAALRAGDTVRARRAYEDFFTLWKDADPDIPILRDARQEYAALP